MDQKEIAMPTTEKSLKPLTKEQLAKPVTFKQLDKIFGLILPEIRKHIAAQPVSKKAVSEILDAFNPPLREIHAEITELRAEIAELKARPLLEDGGIWNAEKLYRPGAQVTHANTIWVALQLNSNARPGHSEGCWRLQAKSR